MKTFRRRNSEMPITLGLAAVNWLLCPYMLKFFTESESIINLARGIMFVDIFIELGRCLNMTFVNSLKAAGAYIFPLIIGLITMWGIGAMVGYTLGFVAGFGVAECLRERHRTNA